MKNAMGSYGEGVIGLAFEGGMDQSQQHQNVVYHLVSQGKLPNAVFGVWINPNTAIGSYDPNGGRLTLGGVDTSLYQGSFTFLSIIGSDGPSGYNYFWAVPAGSFSAPGFSAAAPSGFKTYFDTGSTIINIDSGTFQSLLGFLSSKSPSAFKSSGAYYTIDCGIGRSLPDITINLGGASFVLSSSDYIIPIPNNPVCALGKLLI
ncbi:hypothetical protein HDU99_005511 [Rhizoclosmatium hyalinum]|nr:hypothetical protein HDU99_005511 [Rhizoclosmatium hyalinum]